MLPLLVTTLFCATGVPAQAPTPPPPSSASHPVENGEILQPSKTIAWTITYNSDLNAVVAGGEHGGSAYLHRIGLIADADLERLLGWRGAKAHASVHAIAGRGLSSHDVGNILTVSGLEAEPALRLFNLWVEQSLDGGASLRAGQFTAGQEFMISNTAALFVNSTFGWPGSFAADLPSGGPAYPLAAPGARLALAGRDGTAGRIAIFAGDPAGPGGGDPQHRDRHGFNGFRLKGAPFVIAEVSRDFGGDDPRLRLAAGGWIHFGRFEDMGGGPPHSGNYALYALADARLWSNAARSLHGFVRASASPANRNPLNVYADVGVSLSAPFTGRPNDSLGIAIGVTRISPQLRSSLRRQAALAGLPGKVPGTEAVVELTYQLKLARKAYLQPDAQWIIHPAGWVLGGKLDARRPKSSALVVGMRTSLTF